MTDPVDPDPEDDDGRQIWWPGYVITDWGIVRKKYTVVIITDDDAGVTPDEIMNAIQEGVNEQNPGVEWLAYEVEGE